MIRSLYRHLRSLTQLTDLVGQNIYLRHIPQGQTEFPLVTLQMISNTHEEWTGGAAGIATARVQVDCWSRRPSEAEALAEIIRLQLQGFIGSMEGTDVCFISLDSDFDLSEAPRDASENWKYRRVMDLMVKYRETRPTFSVGGLSISGEAAQS